MIIRRIVAVSLAVYMLFTGINASVIGTTEGTPIQATKRDYCFDDDRLLIGGYNYRYEKCR